MIFGLSLRACKCDKYLHDFPGMMSLIIHVVLFEPFSITPALVSERVQEWQKALQLILQLSYCGIYDAVYVMLPPEKDNIYAYM